MSAILRAAVATAVGMVVLFAGVVVRAQGGPPLPPVYTPLAPGQPPEAPKPSVVTPPKLTKFVEATYPPAALAQGLSAKVELELVVGPDGTVKDAKVVTPVGNGFDEAALEAARKFEFEPATRDGQPIGARIRYPYVFELKPPPEPEAEAPPPPGALEGQVIESLGSGPIAGATVVVTNAETKETQQLTTDEEGRWKLENLAPGKYTVHVEVQDRQPIDQEEEVSSGEATNLTYRVEKPPDTEAFSATARISPPPREVTKRVIGKEELTRIPGTRGDALRTVELMPGVARPPLGSGLLIIRGSAPTDSLNLFEGVQVPLLYHFGGLTSFINSRMLDSIEFYPGNFGVRYGRARGGVVEVRAAEIPRDDIHGVIDLNIVDTSFMLQAPVSKDAEIAVAARRSQIDTIFNAALKGNDSVSTIAAPVYYDYQAMAVYRPGEDDKLRLMVYGSSDHLKFLFPQPSDTDSGFVGNLGVGTQFHRLHASWRHNLSDRVEQDTDVAVGYGDIGVDLGNNFAFSTKGSDIHERSEWRARVNDNVRMIGGLDLFFFPASLEYSGPPIGQSEGNPNASQGTLGNSDHVNVHENLHLIQPALYVESDITFQPWVFILGSRVDYYSDINNYSYDPRGAIRYSITPTTVLKTGVGLFSQPPSPLEDSRSLGNPHLKAQHALHTEFGAEQKLAENVTIDLSGFYKHLTDRVIGTDFGQAPHFVTGGEGRIYGLETQLRILPNEAFLAGRFFGYLSYTLSRSERKDHPSDRWALFDYDQTHILTVSAVYRLGRGWETGFTLRLVSGNPNTPVTGANLNVITDLYSPVFGMVNSQRARMFNRLDFHIEKKWTFPSWKLALYLDVQNVYNEANPEGVQYDYEYKSFQYVRGLPIIPVLGLRGEL